MKKPEKQKVYNQMHTCSKALHVVRGRERGFLEGELGVWWDGVVLSCVQRAEGEQQRQECKSEDMCTNMQTQANAHTWAPYVIVSFHSSSRGASTRPARIGAKFLKMMKLMGRVRGG